MMKGIHQILSVIVILYLALKKIENIYLPFEDEITISVEIPELNIKEEQTLGLDTVKIIYLTLAGHSMKVKERNVSIDSTKQYIIQDTIKGRPNEIIITPFREHHTIE